MRRALFIGLSLGLVLGCGQGRTETSDGTQLFNQICFRCHGADGKGDPVEKLRLGVPDMTDPAWQARHTDEDIKRTVREGSRSKKMPPFGDAFRPDQLDALVRHVRAFGGRAR